MAPKRASKQQQQLNVDQFKLLKKPMDHLGKQINVPGSFWQGRMLPEERDKVYKCTTVDFSLAHKFAPDSSPRKAFKMQEMGIDGTGRHEESDLASTMYWIDYPMPFLSFYYDTFPAVDDGLAGAAEVASLASSGRNGFNDSASDGCASSATVPHTDVHPEFPSLRIPSAVIYQFFKVISDKLIEMGPTSGKFAALWECTILDEGVRACCNRRRINHGAEDVELVDSIHTQNAPPHRAEMGDESAKSKGKPPNPTAFAVQFVLGLLTTLLSSENTPGIDYGALAKIQNPWRRRRTLPEGV